MAVILGSIANLTIPAAAEGLARDDAIAGLEARDAGAEGEDCTGAFVGGGDGEFDREDAFEVFEVGVAEGGDGDFEEEVVFLEVLG